MELQRLHHPGAELLDILSGGIDETEVADSRSKDTPGLAVFYHVFVPHWDIRGKMKLVEPVFKLHLSPVGDAEGVPSVLFRDISHFINMPVCRLRGPGGRSSGLSLYPASETSALCTRYHAPPVPSSARPSWSRRGSRSPAPIR